MREQFREKGGGRGQAGRGREVLWASSSTKSAPSDPQIPICAGLAHTPVLGSPPSDIKNMH